jgi:AcrR family transcriptional regulator
MGTTEPREATEAREATDQTPTDTTAAMDTRERILYATWQLLEKGRGQGVRLEDIAKVAGVSRQAIYLHFGSRAELFIATVRYVDKCLHLPEQIQAICEEEGTVGIAAFISWWANTIPQIYGLVKALLALRETDEAAAAAWADRMHVMYSGCLAVMRDVQQRGNGLAPDWTARQAADFLWAMLSIEIWEYLTIERGWSKEQYVERLRMAAERTLTQQR